MAITMYKRISPPRSEEEGNEEQKNVYEGITIMVVYRV